MYITNQGNILRLYDNLIGALQRFRDQEQICRQMKDAKSLAINFANQSLVLHRQVLLPRANNLAKDALFIAKAQGYFILEKKFQAIVEQVQKIPD